MTRKSDYDDKICRILRKIGLSNAAKLCDTLQGSIWRAPSISKYCSTSNTTIIKVTNKFLQQKSIAIVDDKIYNVDESIVSEQHILKYLNAYKNCPSSIIKFVRFFKSKTDYFLLEEDGGTSLLEFVRNAHKYIQSKELSIADWIETVKVIFRQIIECIDFMHSKNVCHFDISLENFLINEVYVEVITEQYKKPTFRFVTKDIQIKICDFGLAELFERGSDCLSDKYCGKTVYKSPENFSKKNQFDAKKNDVWCIGVSLFMMLFGVEPWSVAHETDEVFTYIMNGYIIDILEQWNYLEYVDVHLINLFELIFQYEADRINITDIKKHRWLQYKE